MRGHGSLRELRAQAESWLLHAGCNQAQNLVIVMAFNELSPFQACGTYTCNLKAVAFYDDNVICVRPRYDVSSYYLRHACVCIFIRVLVPILFELAPGFWLA